MLLVIEGTSARLEDRLFGHLSDAEERRRRLLLGAGLVTLLPTLGAFTLGDLRRGSLLEALPALLVVALLAANLLLLRRPRGLWVPVRLSFVFGLGTIVHHMILGVNSGMTFLWLYPMPLMMIVFFGWREGLLWATASLAGALIALCGLVGEAQPAALTVRFTATFVGFTLLSLGWEMARERYQRQLERETEAIEQTLEQVKVLRGLLPICAACKRIRDDRGLWNRIALYVGEHSEAELRESFCPRCDSRPEASS